MAFDAGRAIAYLTMDTSQYQEGIGTAGKLMGQLGDGSLSAGDKLRALGSAATQMGKTLTTAVTTSVTALGTISVKTFASYDDAIRQVQATMAASDEDMAKLSAKAKEMGVSTRYSASNAADALNYLALAGYNADQACEALPRVLALAQAGNLDLAYASDLATDAMSALGLGIGELTRFTDEMAKTSQKSNTSVGQLGEAILTVGGTAKTLAGGTVELNTQLGILADNGIKGAEGGTMLRNVILSLSAPTDQAAKAMRALGLECYDANGKFRGTNEIFRDLDGILATMDDKQRADVLNKLFNKVDLKGVEALLSNCTDRYAALSAEIENSAGATQTMADTMEAGIGGSFRSLASAAEGAALAFGESLIPTVQSVTEFITRLAKGFAELPQETQRTIGKLALLAAAAGPVLIVGGKLISLFGSLGAIMSGPMGWITLGIAGVAALVTALGSIEAPAQRAGRALERSTENIDPKEAEAYAEAFGAINLQVDVSAAQPERQIADAWGRVAAALQRSPLTPAQIAQIKGMIGQDYQEIYDALVAFGLPEEQAAALAQAVADAGAAVDAALDGFGLSEGQIAQVKAEIGNGYQAVYNRLVDFGLSDDDAALLATRVVEAGYAVDETLSGLGLSDAQLAQVAAAIDGGYQAVYDKLLEFGLSEEEADELAQSVTETGDTLSGKLAELNVGADAGTVLKWFLQARGSRLAMLGAAKSAGLSQTEIAQIAQVYDDMTGSITGSLPNLVSEIYDALTDGETDDEESLLSRIQSATEQSFAQVDEWLAGKVGELDENSASYAQDVAALQAQAETYKTEISGLDSQMRALVSGLANQPAAVVRQRLAEFEALERRANTLAAQLDEVNAKGRASEDQNVRLVRAGVTDDAETVAKAFEVTYQDMALNKADINDKARADIQAARDAWTAAYDAANRETSAAARKAAREAADVAYQEAEAGILAGQQAQLAEADRQYEAALQALFAGLAARNPEVAAQLKEIMDRANLLEELRAAMQAALDNPEGIRGVELSPAAQKALLDFSAFDSLDDVGNMEGLVTSVMQELSQSAVDSIEGMDTGSLGLAYKQLLETGLLEGTDIDVSTLEAQLNLLVGGLDTGEGAAEAGEGFGEGYAAAITDSSEAAQTAGQALADAGADGAADTDGYDADGQAAGERYASGVAARANDSTRAGKTVADSGARGARENRGYRTAGEAAGQGYAAGLRSKIEEVRRAARALADAGQVSVRKTDDTHSPSRKYREMGGFGGEGYALGLRDKMPAVRAAAAELVGLSLARPLSLAARQAGAASVVAPAARPAAGDAPRALTVEIRVDKLEVRSDRDIERIAQRLGDYIKAQNYA